MSPSEDTGRPPETLGQRGSLLDAGTRRALEAILFVVEEPVQAHALAQVLEVPTDDVLAALHALHREYADEGRGFVLREVGGGWRLYSDPGAAPYVERFVLAGKSARLSQAALETLAIVAYKQPVTRAQVSDIRGVDADGAVRGLVSRGLVQEVGRDPSPGQPLLYSITPAFLERLGLRDLGELPPLPEHQPPGRLPAEPALGAYKAARRELDTLQRAAPEEPDPAAPDLPDEGPDVA
ncbi:MAG: SMC-Scp complex subunit ScpB [Nitriliruptorales bacterium]|nr:SMC-Scp complex subunit ScpB [Nitriliruptorales bacterium]